MTQIPQPGHRFGRYRIERQLGSGGMGVVFLATDLRLDRPVALKLMLADLTHREGFLARFRREAESLGRLESEHVVAVYDYGEHDGMPYIATQYVAGGDLGQALAGWGAMPAHLAVTVCAQVSEALAASHRAGVLHRDVKPSNVLMHDPSGPRPHAYLCDFGIAHTEEPGTTATGSIAGSWAYLAPERTRGAPGTPASDIYAVGCLLWACLTGRPPYAGTDVEVAYAHLSAPIPQFRGQGPLGRGLNAILQGTLAKDPAARYPDAGTLARDLRAAAAESPDGFDPAAVAVPAAPALPAVRRRRRRLPAVLVAGGLVVALGVGGAAVLAAGGDDGDGPDGPAESNEVTGDVDGDGLGDVTAVTVRGEDRGTRFTWRSDGEQPMDAEEGKADGYLDALSGDFDGDGRTDVAEVDLYVDPPDTPSLRVTYAGGDTGKVEFTAPALPEPRGPRATFSGDFDGNGYADLAFAVEPPGAEREPLNPLTGSGMSQTCALWVLRNEEGILTEPERWQQDIPCFVPDLTVIDLASDGRDDLVWAIESGDAWQGSVAQHNRLVPLTSTGSAFDTGSPIRVPGSTPGDHLRLTAGDVNGDGRDDLVAAAQRPRKRGDYDLDYLVFPGGDGGLGEPERWMRTTRYAYELKSAILAVSDVNGDGRDDLVNATAHDEVMVNEYDRNVRDGKDVNIDVLLSRADDTLEPPTQWAVCKGCAPTTFDIIDPVVDFVSAG